MSNSLVEAQDLQNEPKHNEPPRKRLKITAGNGYLALTQTHRSSSRKTPAAAPLKRVNSKAKLWLLPSLPIDILFEIFGHLLPLDVLHLARTNKEFRRVLMHSSATSAWKAAFANVPALPECPSDMVLPQFANLAFDLHCHKCLTINVRTIYWNLRIRICSKCAKKALQCSSEFSKDDKKDHIILRCVPFDTALGRRDRFCLFEDKLAFVNKLDSLSGERTEFVEKTKSEMKARTQKSKLYREWSDSLVENRNQELDDIRKKRREAIEAKLTALGHAEELDYIKHLSPLCYSELTLFTEHPDVKVPKLLTEKMWTNMLDEMLDYMAEIKTHRLNSERHQLMSVRRQYASEAWFAYREKHCKAGNFLPGQVDLWYWDKVKSLVERPNEAVVEEETFKKLFDAEMPLFIDEWRKARLGELYEKSERSALRFKWRVRGLQLACCVFTCVDKFGVHAEVADHRREFDRGRQYLPMWFPEFMHHGCNAVTTKAWRADEKDIPELSDYACLQVREEYAPWCRRRRWTAESLEFDEKASKVVKNIVAACGLDGETASTEEMDKLDARVVCLKCSFGNEIDGDRIFSVMSWRTALRHCMKVHWGDSAVKWQKLSDEDTALAKQKEKANGHVKSDKIWRCALCVGKKTNPGVKSKADIRQHIHDNHESECEENVDYFRALDIPPEQPPAVKMVPQPLVGPGVAK